MSCVGSAGSGLWLENDGGTCVGVGCGGAVVGKGVKGGLEDVVV